MVVKFVSVLIGISILSSPAMAATNKPNHTTQSQTPIKSETAGDSQKNLEASQKFLADNKKKKGVITTASGLQYKEIKPGKGKSPGPYDLVTVEYKGTLLNGQEFDNSAKHKGPVKFELDAIIPGWREALQLMKPGAEWVVYIPPQLAYGDKGVPGVIPSNALLIFDIKLVSNTPPAQDIDSEVLPDPVEKD